MPRRASYSLPSLGVIPARTASDPRESIRGRMLAAEALIPTIDPSADYALSQALASVIGGSAGIVGAQVVSGRELIADLTTLVLDLSERLELTGDERDGGAGTLEELAQELGVASKTLQRWRRSGLCAHWIVEEGRTRVAIYREALARYTAHHGAEIERARSFRRIDGDERRALVEAGRALIAAGASLNQAAKQVAAAHGRSHEGVRLIYLREFGASARRRQRSIERIGPLVERAWRFAIEPSRVAERLGKSESYVRALVDRRRGERLRAVQPSWIELSTFDLPGADETIPFAPAARRLQPLGLRDGNLLEAIESAREIRRLHARESRGHAERDETRAAAMHFLLRRASRAIDALERWPERATVDQIETDLRFALRLRALLVERALVIALGRADHFCDIGPERLPSDELRALARSLVEAVHGVVTAFDPSRQRFERAVSLAADYALAKRLPMRRSTRAAARHSTGVAHALLGEVAQWQAIVDPLAHRRQLVERLVGGTGETAVAARLLARRYGFGGEMPRTIERMAQEDRTTIALMTKRLREAEAVIRRA
ncbi:MAG: hypothetical protein GC172_13255 [Phycisphaera sp.]|nr:hypothetical protein [Phycisphaera sp.]